MFFLAGNGCHLEIPSWMPSCNLFLVVKNQKLTLIGTCGQHLKRCCLGFHLLDESSVCSLSCQDSHETVIQQQSSVRVLFGILTRLTTTKNPSCPQHHYLQWFFEETWMSYDYISFSFGKIVFLNWISDVWWSIFILTHNQSTMNPNESGDRKAYSVTHCILF